MSRSRIYAGIFASCLLVLLPVISCGNFLGFSSGGTGTLRLLVTDKPFPFDFVTSALVTITRIEVHATSQPASQPDDDETDDDQPGDADKSSHANPGQGGGSAGGGASTSTETQSDSGDGGFITIFEGSKSFDLLKLRNGMTDLLADADIPAGAYDQMRLIVTGGKITLTDGRMFDLKVPSGEQAGIKLHFMFEVMDGQDTVLLLDVDLSRAFSAIPSGHIDTVDTIREFHFHPSFAMRLINVLEAGSISGHVTDESTGDPLASAAVTAFDETDTEVTTTTTDADGAYLLGGLHAGTYRVHFAATNYEETDVTGVAVVAAQETMNVDAALTPLPGSITGHVTNSTDSMALAGVDITVLDASNTVVGSASTGADGAYTVSDVPPGTYRVHASIANFVEADVNSVTVLASQPTTDVDVALTPI